MEVVSACFYLLSELQQSCGDDKKKAAAVAISFDAINWAGQKRINAYGVELK